MGFSPLHHLHLSHTHQKASRAVSACREQGDLLFKSFHTCHQPASQSRLGPAAPTTCNIEHWQNGARARSEAGGGGLPETAFSSSPSCCSLEPASDCNAVDTEGVCMQGHQGMHAGRQRQDTACVEALASCRRPTGQQRLRGQPLQSRPLERLYSSKDTTSAPGGGGAGRQPGPSSFCGE